MVCSTLRQGFECIFMNKKGCQFNGGSCYPIIDQCNGCQKVVEYPTGKYCMSFLDPVIKCKNGICNMATHIQIKTKKGNNKINPLKASKRSR